jgi:hypothetical protein
MIKKILGSAALLSLPAVVSAQQGLANSSSGGQFGTLLGELLGFSNNILIPFILGIGFLVFVWGMFRFFIAGGANDEEKEKGKSLMVWATLGFVLIIVFWGVVNLLATSTGLDRDGEDFNLNSLGNIEIDGPPTRPPARP